MPRKSRSSLHAVGEEVRGEESGESSSSLSVAPDVEDGAALPLPERPDAILSDEVVCFPSLDRFSATILQDTKNAVSCRQKLLVSQSKSTQFWLEFSCHGPTGWFLSMYVCMPYITWTFRYCP